MDFYEEKPVSNKLIQVFFMKWLMGYRKFIVIGYDINNRFN